MYCAQCGHEISDRVKFCPQCGSPVESVPEDNVSATTEIMHAEQEQEEDASAQLQNEPASFSTVMDETKTRSKRHIPIAVIVALVLALAAGAAFATYYIYTTYAASQQEEPLEANSEYDNAMAAYTDVLDEYRAFMAYVNDGGDVDSLERNPETYALIEYPHVNDAFTYDTFENIDCNQYAYDDFDGNGIPELIVGDGSNQPIEVYTYSDGAVVDLCGITGARDWWFIDTDGYITNDGSGGIARSRTLYKLNDGNLEFVDQVYLDFEPNGSATLEGLYTILHTTVDGVDETETTYDYDEAIEIMHEFSGSYTLSNEEIALDWQDL